MSDNKWNFDNFAETPAREPRERRTRTVTAQDDQKTTPKQPRYKKEKEPVNFSFEKLPIKKIAICVVALVLVIALVAGLSACVKGSADSSSKDNGEDLSPKAMAEQTVAQAKISAAQYDYDTAIAAVKALEGYDSDKELQSLVSEWEGIKSTLVEFPHDQVTHVFVHSLIYEPELAFDPDKGSEADGYNLVMTTVDEFNKMIESMYQKGFVMVSMHDICTFDEQGNRVDHQIMLPPDKKAFVLSQDDLNYYHFQDGDGIATKLVFDENGKVKNEYITKDGETIIGDFDMVPIIDTFVEQHPDFSYKGHKGILALTGYNGILGYRTDSVYADRNDPHLDPDQIEFLDRTPDFNYEQEVAEAKKIADAMKANGWEFASHTWGHITVPNCDMERVQGDNTKWKNYVGSIIGPTDVLIFPNGADLAGTEEYDSYNERFNYLTSEGFRIFCPVDSTPYWQQKGDNYFRMSRRNLDGYRMYHDPERLEDLFNVDEVFDPKRPTPVPSMSEVYG